MPETVKVEPTPIQRNAFDVAVELTQLFADKFAMDSREDIEEAFIKFYAIAVIVGANYPSALKNFLPEELRKAIYP